MEVPHHQMSRGIRLSGVSALRLQTTMELKTCSITCNKCDGANHFFKGPWVIKASVSMHDNAVFPGGSKLVWARAGTP